MMDAQASELEELLAFLRSVPPLAGLGREVLTSLAVFAQPLSCGAGGVLTVAGAPADTLLILQVSRLSPAGSAAACLSGCGHKQTDSLIQRGP
jgi:hypothetical protein